MDHEPETSRGEDGFRSRIRSRGRRRRFDTDKVLDSALLAFWRKGFSATSLDDLVVATGVKRPSLYLAFGNKERFYLQAIDRFRRWLNEETAQRLDLEAGVADVSGRIRRYIDFLIDLYVGNGRSPKGDVIICSSVADTSEHDAVRQLLVRYIQASDRVLKAFLTRRRRWN